MQASLSLLLFVSTTQLLTMVKADCGAGSQFVSTTISEPFIYSAGTQCVDSTTQNPVTFGASQTIINLQTCKNICLGTGNCFVGTCEPCYGIQYSQGTCSICHSATIQQNTFSNAYMLTATTVCEDCVAGKYKATYGSEACTPCPEGTESKTASTSIEDCLAPACAQNQYSSNGDCTACPEHSVSQRAQVKCYNEGTEYCVCANALIGSTLDNVNDEHNPVIYYPAQNDSIVVTAEQYLNYSYHDCKWLIVPDTPVQTISLDIQTLRSADVDLIEIQRCTNEVDARQLPGVVCEPVYYQFGLSLNPHPDNPLYESTVSTTAEYPNFLIRLSRFLPKTVTFTDDVFNFQYSTTPFETEDCVCEPQYTGDFQACEPCPLGYAKMDYGSQACTSDMKTCDPGFGWDAPQQVCAICTEGKYTLNNFCTACASGKSSWGGSSSAEDCYNCPEGKYTLDNICTACTAGKTAPAGSGGIDACVHCVEGKYSSNNLCLDCAIGQSSPPASLNSGYCYNCLIGKYAVDNICIDCAAGESSPSASDSVDDCYQCSAGKFAFDTSIVILGIPMIQTECKFCPSNSNSVQGSTYCVCDDGYIGCLNCTDYKACKQCDKHTEYYDSEAHMCFACAAGMFTVDHNDEACVCGPAYTYTESGCTLCEAGKYKENYGNETCEVCAGTVDSTSTLCFGCAVNSQHVDSTCQCNAGFYRNDFTGTCRQCETGTYKTHIGDDNCDSCNAVYGSHSIPNVDFTNCACDETYAPQDATCECVNKQTVCVCAAGFYLVDADIGCSECEAGKHKPLANADDCTACGIDIHGVQLVPDENHTTCICPDENHVPFYNSDLTIEKCRCDAGYQQDGGTCVPCDPGMYKEPADIENDNCNICPAYMYVSENRTSCTCPSNSVAVDASLDCQCNAGYTGDRALSNQPDFCTACAAGSYKSTVGTDDCTACPENMYTDDATVSTDISNCKCGGGYKESSSISEPFNWGAVYDATICVDKTVQNPIPLVAETGQSNQRTPVTVQMCKAICLGTVACLVGTCQPCHGIEYDTQQLECSICHSAATQPSTHPFFQNEDVYMLTTTPVCEECAVGKYAAAGALFCQDCGADKTTLSAAATSSDACVCNAGYFHDYDNSCTQCPTGYTKLQPGHTPCYPCFEDTYWVASDQACSPCAYNYNTNGQTAQTSCDFCNQFFQYATSGYCECMAGYQANGETCSVCPASTFKAGISSAACQSCPEHQTNNADSTSCVCNAGYEGTIDGVELTCTLCSEKTFKNTAGNQACVVCGDTGDALTSDATRTQCICDANTENQDGVCVACEQNEESQAGEVCRCMPGYGRLENGGACVLVEEKCNVNQRLPRFALKLERNNDLSTSQSSTRFASREQGGVCHMQRLMQVNNSLSNMIDMNAVNAESTKHSIQYCTHNDTSVTCSMLEQNSANVAQSYVYMDTYSAQVGQAAPRKQRHYKEKLCSQCDEHKIDKIFSRLDAEENIMANTDRQMSFGEPFRISPARMMYSRLHRAVCHTNATCDKLQEAIVRNMSAEQKETWCGSDTNCMSRSTFSKALLMPQQYSDQAIAPSTDALWARNWVFCPHHTSEQKQCSGSVDKATWLNASLRQQACAVAMNAVTREDRAPVHFCLLNADTEELCSKLVQWREDVRSILCEAAGLCPSTDFFYFPGMFNMHEQEFVYDSVTRFYVQDTQQQCYENTMSANGDVEQCTPATALLYAESNKPACFIGNAESAQVQSNAIFMQDCASVSIEPFVVITQQLRTIKQMLLLIVYHSLRIQWQLAHVLVAVIIDQVTDYTQTTTDVVRSAATKLLREVVAFVQSISKLFDVLKQSVVALIYSRGIGGWLKKTIEVICQIVEWLHNIVWAEFVCPMMKFILDFATSINNFLQELVKTIGSIPGVPTQWAENILLILETILLSVQDFLKDCSQKEFSCTDDSSGIPAAERTGALPMPTRCWSTYLTFFGDNQQLQCTAADTCRAQGALGLSASEYIVCGRCPKLDNNNIRDYGCDALTKLCSCAVPILHTSHCSSNEDCLIADAETSCKLIKNDLTLSKTTILCDECQYQRTCLHDVVTGLGTCACGFQRTPFQTCTAADVTSQNAITLMYNNLCLYSMSREWLTFQTELTIPCQDLDATSGTCAWVPDLQKYLVRGYRTTGRRLLQAESVPPDVFYETLDPLCRDALAMPQLSHTRQACRKAYLDSVATLTQLDLQEHIHACALCSLSDLKESIVSHPLIWIHVATRPKVMMQMVKRHGILQEFISFCTAVYHSLHTVHQLLHDENGTELFYFVHNTTTNISSVVIDEKIVPKHIVYAIYRLQNSFPTRPSTPLSGSAKTQTNNTNSTVSSSLHNRQLLFFRELIKSVHTGVQQGWEQADRLNDNFVSGVSLMHNYKYVPSADGQEFSTIQWPPYNADAGEQTCSELADLLNISIRVANGMLLGLLTLTSQRDSIQATPASSLRKAWPSLEQPTGEYAVPAQLLQWNQTNQNNSDPVVTVTIDALDWVFTSIGFDPVDAYNLFYSLAVVARDSFECPYEAVQSCSHWRVRLWQGFIIVTFWFSIVSFVMRIFGISFASQFLLPLHTLALLRLCYGFTWTCFPMIPICAWQDFAESFDTVFPLQILIPDELKHTSAECVYAVLKPSTGCEDYNKITTGVVASNTTHCMLLSKYPSAECLKTCRDAPFEYESVLDVIAWAIAEIGNWAVKYFSNNAHRVPFFDDEAFVLNLVDRVNQLDRGKASLIRAHRICAVLSSYMLIPYILFFLVALAYVMTLVQLLGAQLYPFILCTTSLFAAVTVRDDAANEQDDEYVNSRNDDAEFESGTTEPT